MSAVLFLGPELSTYYDDSPVMPSFERCQNFVPQGELRRWHVSAPAAKIQPGQRSRLTLVVFTSIGLLFRPANGRLTAGPSRQMGRRAVAQYYRRGGSVMRYLRNDARGTAALTSGGTTVDVHTAAMRRRRRKISSN
jgi:hypothetical protein